MVYIVEIGHRVSSKSMYTWEVAYKLPFQECSMTVLADLGFFFGNTQFTVQRSADRKGQPIIQICDPHPWVRGQQVSGRVGISAGRWRVKDSASYEEVDSGGIPDCSRPVSIPGGDGHMWGCPGGRQLP